MTRCQMAGCGTRFLSLLGVIVMLLAGCGTETTVTSYAADQLYVC